MPKWDVRWFLLAILVASLAAAGYFLRGIERRASDLDAAEVEVDDLLTRLGDALTGIGTAQQSYVAPGQLTEVSFRRMSALLGQFYADAATVGPRLRSPEAAPVLQALADGADALIAADTRARENLRLGQQLMAADVIFSDTRNTLDTMIVRLRELRAAERIALDTQRAALVQERRVVLGAMALLWMSAVFALVLLPAPAPAYGPSPRAASHAAPADLGRAAPAPPQPTAVDLPAAADLCAALSRLSDPAVLPALVSRAADLLDASGIILWMSAGEELFAVTAYGYQPQLLARLGPIAGSADNATAIAWRTGRMTTVARDGETNGAVVAPMLGPEACIGVFAVEVRHGRERDGATQAVASMIAAQLATVLSAWPVASVPQPPDASAEAAPRRARQKAHQSEREPRSASA